MDSTQQQSVFLTICVPTRFRSGMLRQALQSIIDSDLRPSEVVVGDNGGDAETRSTVDHFRNKLNIVHIVHMPALDYGGNLRKILEAANGEWVGVIHDDDFYLPDIGEYFRRAISTEGVDFWFSDHLLCLNDGTVLTVESRRNSEYYLRADLQSGTIVDPMASALSNQVCLDGWIARKKLINSACLDFRWPAFIDTQYLLSFALNAGKWWFERSPTFVYRLNPNSLTAVGLRLDQMYAFLSEYPLSNTTHSRLRAETLRRIAPVAVTRWLKAGDFVAARACLRGPYYSVPHTLRGALKYLVQVVWAHLWPRQ